MDLLIPKADIVLPADASLMDEVSRILLSQSGLDADLSRFRIVFPGRRPALYLRRRLAKLLKKPFLPPEIFDIDSFMLYLANTASSGRARVEVEHEHLIYLLYQSVKSVLERRSATLSMCNGFDEFYFWGSQLLDVLDEFGVELVPVSQLGPAVEYALEDAGLTDQARGIWSLLPDLYQSWQETLFSQGVWSRGEIYRYGAEAAQNGVEMPSTLYLCGFVALNKAEYSVFNALQSRGIARIVTQESCSDSRGLPAHDTIHFHQAHDLHSQVRRAREILLSYGASGQVPAPEEIALVLPKPEPLVPVLNWVLEDLSVPFNISMGYPLNRTPVYYLIDHIFRAQEGREDGYYLQHYLAVLSHPYIKGLGTPDYDVDDRKTPFRRLVRHLNHQMRERRNMFVSLDEVEDIAGEFVQTGSQALDTLALVHRVAFKAFEQVDTVGGLSHKLMDLLSLVVQEGPAGRHPLSNEFAGTALSLLERLSTGPMSSETGSYSGLFAMFRHLIRQTRIPFQGSPLDGLQVLGFLETRCLRFKRIVILDLMEGVLPPEAAPSPLLPPGLRNRLHLPDRRSIVDISRQHLLRLLSGAQEVHILFIERDEASRSRFVDELIWREEKHAQRVGVADINKVASPARPCRIPPEGAPKSAQVLYYLRRWKFSPTSLDTYLHCPYRFYLKYVLKLDPGFRSPVEQIDALLVGEVVHEVLRQLYEPYLNRDIVYEDLEKEMPVVLEAVLRQKVAQENGLKGGFRLLYEVIRTRLGHMLRIERQSGPGRPLSLELFCQSVIGSVAGHEVILRGTLDRVDRRADGNILVIDYKTGSSLRVPALKDPLATFERRVLADLVRSLQLPVYLFLIRNHLGWDRHPWEKFSACLYSLKGLTGRSEGKNLVNLFLGPADDMEYVMDQVYLPAIRCLLEEILNPDLAFEPDVSDPDYCGICPYAGGMCRI